ncbi:PREDICTED: pre-mRNA-splicing factor CWC25-like isoform X2 [Vollenhovia emeryi]|uniref:pre-mRNA-splicing factor CWC25-like isoform X2 n=1 Tax=Vollenhovia emeryi TaxID=411798 RepID=UPI0005F494E0|nr:PREDICTED: pre-mRNA-splicing factor CWC25-like isoform X2 [Vollenhovia emeryi]
MDPHKRQPTSEEQKQERLRQTRKKWRIEQEYEKEHEKRKLKMIEKYERNRAEAIKTNKKHSLHQRRSKSNSPQRRDARYPEHSKERNAPIANGPEGIIDMKELHKIKTDVHQYVPPEDRDTSSKIKRDILNPHDIILPRRQNEGEHPLFRKSEIKETEEIWTVSFSRDKQLDKQSTSWKNAHTSGRPDGDSTLRHRSYKSTVRHEESDDDNKKYNYNSSRRQNSSIRDSKEKDRRGSERSLSPNSSALYIRNRSRTCYRSRSHSPISERTKDTRDKRKFSSGTYPDHLRGLDNRVFPETFANYPFSGNFYNPYVRFCGIMPIPEIPTPRIPMLMPPFPVGAYLMRPPLPRFGNGRGSQTNQTR